MEKTEYLVNELRKLGLDKKEATAYLLLLEMGSVSVQQLAPLLGLSRPSVYRVLEKLQKLDLVFKQKKEKSGKRSYFVAGSPDHFLRILKVQRRRAEEQEREFLRIISILQTKHHLISDKNEIKVSMKKVALEDLSNTSENIFYVLVGNRKTINLKELEKVYTAVAKRLGGITVKELHCKDVDLSKLDFVARKKTDCAPAGLEKSVLAISSKAFLFEKDSAFCIEQDNIVALLKNMFRSIWNSDNSSQVR